MKKALTFIEVVFVIVIIGILSAILAPNFKGESLEKASFQLASHIRYVQHLALLDDKFDSTLNNWYKRRWHISFNGTKYTIGSDLNQDGTISSNEIAKNPSNINLLLTGDTSLTGVSSSNYTRELDLSDKFAIQAINLSSSCANNNNSISFDYLGRPIKDNSSSETSVYSNTLLHSDCQIKIKDDQGNSATLTIRAETGYVDITF